MSLGRGCLWGLDCVLITRPRPHLSQLLSDPSPPNSYLSVRWSLLFCVCLCPPLLAPLRPCLCGRKPPTFQSLDPALGVPTHPPSHFPELSSALLLPLSWSKALVVRKRMEPALLRVLGTQPLPRNLLRRFWRRGRAPLSSPWPLLGRRDTAGSQKVLLARGHHHPRTLSEDAFPIVLVSREPPAPNPPSHPPGPCPRMQMSVCACWWGATNTKSKRLAVGTALEGGALRFICCTFLDASCRPGPGWGLTGDSSCSQTSRQSCGVRGWGRQMGQDGCWRSGTLSPGGGVDRCWAGLIEL